MWESLQLAVITFSYGFGSLYTLGFTLENRDRGSGYTYPSSSNKTQWRGYKGACWGFSHCGIMGNHLIGKMGFSRLTARLPLAPAWLSIYMPIHAYTHTRILHRNMMHQIGALFKHPICVYAYISIHAYCTAPSCTILVHCLNGA